MEVNRKGVILEAGKEDAAVLARVISVSFQDVARRFSLTPENCPRHPSNCTPAWVESDLGRGVRYFILSQDEVPLGCVGLESARPGLCYLERLAVLPQWRGKGHGRTLARHAMGRARAEGARRIGIGIIAAHTELKHWYARLGFVAAGTRRFRHLPFEVAFMEFRLDDRS